MRSWIVALSLMLVSGPALAEDKSVDHAFFMCRLIDSTGMGSAPCEVSGWNQSVTANLDMTSSEARQLCQQVAGLMRDQGRSFGRNWTFQIVSPYSGGNSIAFCNLPN